MLHQGRRCADDPRKAHQFGHCHLEFSAIPVQHPWADEGPDGPHRGHGPPVHGPEAQGRRQCDEFALARVAVPEGRAEDHSAFELRLDGH